ncbi:carbonic anhydrase [Aspergillus cavernicola]|uniref:Carbonic anhydrase n=1 Tax=Aspergillus cavernicola TaxID=176166 RepID=A0ABR4IP36_9EURO
MTTPIAAPTCPPIPTRDNVTALLCRNKAWAARTALEYPCLFPELEAGQDPKTLWIGCSDSRCPETTLLELQPGDVFVHRNIANILHETDLNSSTVIKYAIDHLHVKHVVVCGHTHCGGVAAALSDEPVTLPWLLPLQQLYRDNIAELEKLPAEKGARRLVELNVLAGVNTLKQTDVVLEAMQKSLKVYGLVYDVGSGILHELVTNNDTLIKRQFTSKSFEMDC